MYGCRFNRLCNHLFRVCLLAVFGLSLNVQAQMSTDTANELGKWWQASTNGFKTVPPQSPGSFVVPYNSPSPGVPGEVSMRPSAGSWPNAAAKVTPRGIPGGPVIDVVAKVKPLAAAKAITNFAGKLIFPLQVGMAIKDLFDELGVVAANGPNGLTFTQSQSGYYWDTLSNSGSFVARFPTKGEACALAVSRAGNGTGSCFDQGETDFGVFVPPSSTYYGVGHRTNIPSESTVVMTREAFENMIASKSGWPETSAIARVISDAIKSGETVATEPAVVSGPATSPATVTTKARSDGTTETSTTTNNYTYEGNNVKVSNVTTTTNYNPTTNTTTTEVATTQAPGKEEKPSDCEANPSRAGCSELDAVPDGVIPKETKNISYAAESLNWGASATCPAPLSYNAPVTGQAITLSYTPFCDIASRMRPFILAGAAFVAMMIVMAGIKA